MKKTKKKVALKILALITVILLAFAIYWVLYLEKAHATFKNYYNFRGCTQLISKMDNYGYCRIKDGSIIKIVKYKGKWFLDGDLPRGFLDW